MQKLKRDTERKKEKWGWGVGVMFSRTSLAGHLLSFSQKAESPTTPLLKNL